MGTTIDSNADNYYNIFAEMTNAVQAIANIILAEYGALLFIQKGCGSGQLMVINPVVNAATSTTYGLFMSMEGSGTVPGTLECILPSKACQENLEFADKSLNGMDAVLTNPGLDPNAKTVSTCSYSIEASDVGAQVEAVDNVDSVGSSGQGNAEFALSFGPPPSSNTSGGSQSNAANRIAASGIKSAASVAAPAGATADEGPGHVALRGVDFWVGGHRHARRGPGGDGGRRGRPTRAPSQTSEISASTSTPAAGSFDQYTATVTGATNPTGTVTFTDNNGVICQNVPVATNGTAECVAQVGNTGTHTIVAGYSGDSLLQPSASPLGLDILAGPASQTIAFSNIFAQQKGASLDLSNYATSSSGLPVSFSVSTGSSSVCSVSGTTLSLNGAGSCTVLANQAGNEKLRGSTSGLRDLHGGRLFAGRHHVPGHSVQRFGAEPPVPLECDEHWQHRLEQPERDGQRRVERHLRLLLARPRYLDPVLPQLHHHRRR